MKKKEERIRKEKKNILDHTSGRTKARKMLPCVAMLTQLALVISP